MASPLQSERRQSSPSPPLPTVQVFLSRPAYRLGSSVVGNVRVTWPEPDASSFASDHQPHHTLPTPPSLRDSLVSLQLYAAGRCRIDPRWHQVANYVKLYGPHHPHLNPRVEQRVIQQSLQLGMTTTSSTTTATTTSTTTTSTHSPLKRASSMGTSVMDIEAAAIASSVVCFWATNVVELLELPERPVGAWDQVKPKPIKLHGVMPQQASSEQKQQQQKQKAHRDSWNTTAAAIHPPGHLEKHSYDHKSDDALPTVAISKPTATRHRKEHLVFTFRIDLPDDIPPTFTAASCRYFYSVVVCAKVKTLTSPKVVDILVHVPLTVLLTSSSIMSSSSPSGGLSSATVEDPTRRRSHNERVKVGSCVAMAHSAGLPCHVSATDIQHRHAGPMTVRRRPHASQSSTRDDTRTSAAANNIPTLRVADPYGNPCCILTVIGDTMKWIPGSRVILQLDFPNPRTRRRRQNRQYDEDEEQHGTPLVWIPCYQASACLTGEEVAVYEDGSKKRTRLYSLDTCHEMIDPQTTQRVCLSLFLPLDCPCTVQTDLVEMSVQCRVDITVGSAAAPTSSGGSNPVYTNLRLDLPCRVVQGDDMDGNDNEGGYDNHDDDRHVNNLPLGDLLFGNGHMDHDSIGAGSTDLHLLEKKDIVKDLKVLSLQALDFYE